MLVTLDASQGKVFEGYVNVLNLTNDKLKRRFDNHKALKLFIRAWNIDLCSRLLLFRELIIEIKMIKSTFYNTNY